jgi:hypothetical protein
MKMSCRIYTSIQKSMVDTDRCRLPNVFDLRPIFGIPYTNFEMLDFTRVLRSSRRKILSILLELKFENEKK